MKKIFLNGSGNQVSKITKQVVFNQGGDDDFSDCDGSEVSADEGTPTLPDYAN